MSFTLECPKCGSLNTASRFNPFKKTIQCATCNEEINVKQSRMISKTCSKCGKVIVCDQAKMKGKHCPSCGTPLGIAEATAEYKMTDIICPQCSCQIEIDKTLESTECPICGSEINIKSSVLKKGLVSDTGISVIKYEGDNHTFVWKHPIEDFNWGSQLIVHESQVAIFFMNGQALDTFSKAGKYTLETENLPMLRKAYQLPTGGQKPFHAEVYFINMTVQMGIKWGTDSRVRFIEPKTSIPLDIGASGELNLQVSDPKRLLIKLVGTTGGLSGSDILGTSSRTSGVFDEREVNYSSQAKAQENGTYDNRRNIEVNRQNDSWASTLNGYFKPMVMTAVKTHLSSAIRDRHINILEIDSMLEELSLELRDKISPKFEEYGFFVPQMYVTHVSLPEDDRNFKKLRELLASDYIGRREAEVEAGIIAAQRQKVLEQQTTELERAKFEAEKRRIAAQADADTTRLKGFAKADVMAAQGYSTKDVIDASVQKAYAKGIGNMGGGSGGTGGIASDLLGLGVSMAAVGRMSGQVSEMMGDAFPSNRKTEQNMSPSVSRQQMWKCTCGFSENTGKFCSECGRPKRVLWDCPKCGTKDNSGKFCSECGYNKVDTWICQKCGATDNRGKFCSECGQTREEN